MSTEKVRNRIFRNSNKANHCLSGFFPSNLKDDVHILYAFLRVVDDCVDNRPAKPEEFHALKSRWTQAEAGTPSGDPIVDDFVDLSRRCYFEREWTSAFLRSMEWDLTRTNYDRLEDTLEYIYGSSEVVGFYMARLLGLPREANEGARLLGRAMQYINFIRDMDEDQRVLGRRYLPLEDTGLDKVSAEAVARNPAAFQRFVDLHIALYLEWQKGAEAGYIFLPQKVRAPIMTAADMYVWTALKIRRNPSLIFKRKVKPSMLRVFWAYFCNTLNLGRVRVS